MPYPNDGLATNQTIREVVDAVEVLGTEELATEATLGDGKTCKIKLYYHEY